MNYISDEIDYNRMILFISLYPNLLRITNIEHIFSYLFLDANRFPLICLKCLVLDNAFSHLTAMAGED